MPSQKRPAPSASLDAKAGMVADHGSNWKKRKQERAHTARFIETQTGASSASSSPTASKSSTPAPAQIPTAASGLPTSVELESLVSSRAFQIQSFLRSIRSAKSATTARAWQLLPRHARRRAASHNLLRLPSRLRSKAVAELRSSTTQARTRSDIRKRLPSHGIIRATLRRKKLAERASHPQRRWLETHLWHAKRFRMTTEKGRGKERDQGIEYGSWGFVLPETTMMKSHRASWRSAREFVTLHDASYFSVFRVGVRVTNYDSPSDEGVEPTLLKHLYGTLVDAGFTHLSHSDPMTLCSRRVWDTILVQRKADPSSSGSNGARPATVQATIDAALAPARIVLLSGAQRFKKPSLQQGAYTYDCKEALIFVHPAADLHVRRALKAAGIAMTDETKNSLFSLELPSEQVTQTYAFQLDSAPNPWLAAGGKDSSVSKLERKRRRQAYRTGTQKAYSAGPTYIRDDADASTVALDDEAELRRQQSFNIFELIGPRAAPLLQSVLKVQSGSNCEAETSGLRQILSKHGKSDTSMIEVHVNDPRLSFPPKLKPLCDRPVHDTRAASELVSQVDTGNPSNDELFWLGAKTPRFSKGEIDSRRALSGIPGARLAPDSRDDIVPVVVIRDRLVQKPQMDRFTLIVPRGWGMAFFLSLVATHQSGASSGARVLGQHQLKHQRLELAALSCSSDARKQGNEANMLSYPHNWLGTQAYAVNEKEAASTRQEEWSRRPKGKRTEYLFLSHKDWLAFLQRRTYDAVATKLSHDRTGAARPYPFGGSRHWEWVVSNSERLFGKAPAHRLEESSFSHPWLVTNPESAATSYSAADSALSMSHLASAMVAVKLHAVRKGTVMPLSSLMLAPSFDDHLSWVHHLDSIDHPAMVVNRTVAGTRKMDKQHLKALIDRRCEIMQLGRSAPVTAPVSSGKQRVAAGDVWSEYAAESFDPEQMHDRSADWNNAIGTVLDGDYSLGNGKGFGIGAMTLRAWMELADRQRRIEEGRGEEEKGRRKRRNPMDTSNLLLMREPGTDVVRAVTASLIPLA